jgi:hypothetical protein
VPGVEACDTDRVRRKQHLYGNNSECTRFSLLILYMPPSRILMTQSVRTQRMQVLMTDL